MYIFCSNKIDAEKVWNLDISRNVTIYNNRVGEREALSPLSVSPFVNKCLIFFHN